MNRLSKAAKRRLWRLLGTAQTTCLDPFGWQSRCFKKIPVTVRCMILGAASSYTAALEAIQPSNGRFHPGSTPGERDLVGSVEPSERRRILGASSSQQGTSLVPPSP